VERRGARCRKYFVSARGEPTLGERTARGRCVQPNARGNRILSCDSRAGVRFAVGYRGERVQTREPARTNPPSHRLNVPHHHAEVHVGQGSETGRQKIDVLSVIICSIDDTRFARAAAMYERLLAGEPHEVIRIPDARSMCEGYNRAMRQSRGELLVFSHDDVDILLDGGLGGLLREHLSRFDIIGVAGTNMLIAPIWTRAGPPHIFGQVAHRKDPQQPWAINIYGVPSTVVGNIQAIDGMFMAARRDVAEKVGFDAQTYEGFHLYDIDFSFRAYRAGCKVAVVNDIPVVHESVGREDPSWHRNALAFLQRHEANLVRADVPETFAIKVVLARTRKDARRFMTAQAASAPPAKPHQA
jgi:hypothetical protein